MNPIEITTAAFAKVLEASIAASILALLVLLIQFTLRSRLTPAWRFALWLPVLLRLLLPYVPESPTSLLNLPQWTRSKIAAPKIPPLPSLETTLTDGAPYGVRRAGAALDEPRPIQNHPILPQPSLLPSLSSLPSFPSLPWPTILSLLWLTISLTLLARLALGSLWFNLRLAKNRLPRKPELAELLARLRAELNLRAHPIIIETPLVTSPCLFGFFKPRLLLPANLYSHLTESELSHVILHELAHLKRRDLLTNFLISLAQSIHWFNPIAWLLFRKMRLERELACDQIVLQSRGTTDPKAYGQTLLKLLHDFAPIPSTPALVGIAEDKHAATVRLRRIAQFTPRPSRYSLAGVALLLAIALLGLTNAQTQTPKPPATDDTPALPSNRNSKPISNDERRTRNIEALQSEYDRQKQLVDESLAQVNKMRTELGIVELADGTLSDTTAQEIVTLTQSVSEHRQKTFENNALLEHLKRLPRADLRNALPTMLKPADELLNRYLADLGKAEQDYVSLSGDRADEHPEVRRTSELMAKINKQIEARIDGILLGLEARKKATDEMLKALESEIEQTRHRNARRHEFYVPFFKAKRELDHNQRVLDTIFTRLLAEKVDAQIH